MDRQVWRMKSRPNTMDICRWYWISLRSLPTSVAPRRELPFSHGAFNRVPSRSDNGWTSCWEMVNLFLYAFLRPLNICKNRTPFRSFATLFVSYHRQQSALSKTGPQKIPSAPTRAVFQLYIEGSASIYFIGVMPMIDTTSPWYFPQSSTYRYPLSADSVLVLIADKLTPPILCFTVIKHFW